MRLLYRMYRLYRMVGKIASQVSKLRVSVRVFLKLVLGISKCPDISDKPQLFITNLIITISNTQHLVQTARVQGLFRSYAGSIQYDNSPAKSPSPSHCISHLMLPNINPSGESTFFSSTYTNSYKAPFRIFSLN